MLARRIIAVSPDKAFGKKLAIALKAAGGVVDLHLTADELGKGELGAALLVVHVVDGDAAATASQLIARLSGDGKVIAIITRSDLATVVEIMQASERVAGMLVAEDLDTRQLSAMATRVLAGDIFGLDKLIRWGTQIHSHLVGDYQEKSLCIAQISEFAELMGVRRKYREAIEQCIDEMLMNALYDAPVDEHGKQIFSDIPTKTRISLRVEQKAVVQYACDGKQFAVSVRDAFGTLDRATVLRYLHKCLHNEQQIDRKAGGAGLGLYLMTNASSEVYFNVLPGVATEAVCVFDLEHVKLQLESFGFFHERIDAGGRLAGGPSRRLPAGASHPVERRAGPRGAPPAPPISRAVIALLVAMIGVVIALIGVVAWPRLFPSTARTSVEIRTEPAGATIEVEGRDVGTTTNGTMIVPGLAIGRAYPVVARLDGYESRSAVVQPAGGGSGQITLRLRALAPTVKLDSMPPGATAWLDGVALGQTPLVLTRLAAGTTVAITFKKSGFLDATTTLEVPGPGKETRLVQPLAISDDLARIRIESEPPGAQVIQNGQLVTAVTTPAELLVEAGKVHRFTVTMAGKVPAMIEPFTPARGADGIVKSVTLGDGVALAVTASLDGKISVARAPHCQALATPATCVVTPGTYTVEFSAAGVRATHTVEAKADTTDAFEFGIVQAGPGKRLQLGSGPGVARATVEVGPRRIMVIDEDGGVHPAPVVVKVGATVIAN